MHSFNVLQRHSRIRLDARRCRHRKTRCVSVLISLCSDREFRNIPFLSFGYFRLTFVKGSFYPDDHQGRGPIVGAWEHVAKAVQASREVP